MARKSNDSRPDPETERILLTNQCWKLARYVNAGSGNSFTSRRGPVLVAKEGDCWECYIEYMTGEERAPKDGSRGHILNHVTDDRVNAYLVLNAFYWFLGTSWYNGRVPVPEQRVAPILNSPILPLADTEEIIKGVFRYLKKRLEL